MAGNINNLMALRLEVIGAANFDYTVARGFEVVDVYASTNAGAAGGDTCNVQTNISGAGLANLIGATLAIDTVDDIEYCTTLVPAQKTMTATDVVRAVGNQATCAADCFLTVIPTSWVAG